MAAGVRITITVPLDVHSAKVNEEYYVLCNMLPHPDNEAVLSDAS